MTMTFRTDGAWGSGKGGNLDPVEVDENFWAIMQRVSALETSAPVAISIDTFTVDNNQMTIYLTDGSTHGPFTIPSATWTWTGAWRTNNLYLVNDLFSFEGAVYQVLVAHTSDATAFDPNALSGSGYAYNLLLDTPGQSYDCSMFFNYAIPVNDELILQHVAVRNFYLPADFLLSKAFMRVAPTTRDLTFRIVKTDNAFETETTVGTITFLTSDDQTFDGGMFGTFENAGSPIAAIQFNPGDRLTIFSPDSGIADATAIGLAVTLATITGTAPV